MIGFCRQVKFFSFSGIFSRVRADGDRLVWPDAAGRDNGLCRNVGLCRSAPPRRRQQIVAFARLVLLRPVVFLDFSFGPSPLGRAEL